MCEWKESKLREVVFMMRQEVQACLMCKASKERAPLGVIQEAQVMEGVSNPVNIL